MLTIHQTLSSKTLSMFFVRLLSLQIWITSVWCQDASAPSASAPVILWREEFDYGLADGTPIAPNPDVWTYDIGTGVNGWGNGELETYTSELDNVRVQNGHLFLTAIRTNDASVPFTSGRIHTDSSVKFKYGTITMKAKVPNVIQGLWPAFWTLGQTFSTAGWPQCGEMNVMEVGQGLGVKEGVGNRRVVSAAHWDDNGKYATNAGWLDYPENINGTYHFFTLDWTPEKITTYVDDMQVWSLDISSGSPAALHDFHFVILSLAVGGGFTSGGSSSSSSGCGSSSSAGSSSSGACGSLLTPDDITAPLPASLQVDWIRLFDNTYTILTTSTAAPVSSPSDASVEVPTPGCNCNGGDPPQGTPGPTTESNVVVPPVAAPLSVPFTVTPIAPFTVSPVAPFTVSPLAAPIPQVLPFPSIENLPPDANVLIPTDPPTLSFEPTFSFAPTVSLPPGANIIFRPRRRRRPRRRKPSRNGGKGGKGGKGSSKSSKSSKKGKGGKGSNDDDASLVAEKSSKSSDLSSTSNAEQISSSGDRTCRKYQTTTLVLATAGAVFAAARA